MTDLNMFAIYNKIIVTTHKRGRWQIKCTKGLWSVDAPTLIQATREAQHYFMQYYGDGEYEGS